MIWLEPTLHPPQNLPTMMGAHVPHCDVLNRLVVGYNVHTSTLVEHECHEAKAPEKPIGG